MSNEEIISKVDDVLAQCEDILHGRVGEEVTEARKLLTRLNVNENPLIISHLQKENERLQSLVESSFDRINQLSEMVRNLGGEIE